MLGLFVNCLSLVGLEQSVDTKFVKYWQSPIIKEKTENGISYAVGISFLQSNSDFDLKQ